MASIMTMIRLQDNVSRPLENIMSAVHGTTSAFESMQTAVESAADVSTIEQARTEIERTAASVEDAGDAIRGADTQQDHFNDSIRDGTVAADALGNKLKGVLATAISLAGIKSVLGWVGENLKLSDTQRNAENQLKAVLSNMGVEDINIPVTTDTGSATDALETYENAVSAADGFQVNDSVNLDTKSALDALDGYTSSLSAIDGAISNSSADFNAPALDALDTYSARLDALDGEAVQNAVYLDAGGATRALEDYSDIYRLEGSTANTALQAETGNIPSNRGLSIIPLSLDTKKAASAYDSLAKNVGGNELENTVAIDTVGAAESYENLVQNVQGNEMENTLTLDTAEGLDAFQDFVNTVEGNTVTANMTVNTAQTMSAFDAIAAKASEIQSRGIFGDEAMIAGAAEFATYFSDAEAIMSMMDTLSNYAIGMSNGDAVDAAAMVDYATNLGKIMSGSYDAMSKKGFEFTDVQKAIIEGTATEAQIAAQLGEQYVNASSDMQAAAAINQVISKSWDGLYESMSNTPKGKIIQFNNALGDLRETIGDRLYSAVGNFYGVMSEKFPQIEQIMNSAGMRPMRWLLY